MSTFPVIGATAAVLCFAGALTVHAREASVALHGRPTYVASGDFNGDGRLDFAVSGDNYLGDAIPSRDGYFLSVYEAGPGGEFSARAKTLTRFPVGPLSVADINGNGLADIVSPDEIWFDPGGKAFEDRVLLPLPTGNQGTGVATGDFDGDGRADIAVADAVERSVSFFIYDGGITRVASISLPHYPNSIIAADFNGDGLSDLATLGSKGSVSTLYGESEFRLRSGPTIEVAFSLQGGAAGDLNRDSRVDIVAFDYIGRSAYVLLGAEKSMVTSGHLAAANFVLCVVAGDVTGDGVSDVVMGQPGWIDVFESAQGAFNRSFAIRSFGYPFRMELIDLDGDTIQDILVVDRYSLQVRILYGPILPSSSPRRRSVRR